MLSRTIGFLLFDQYNVLDITGPLEVFDTARQLNGCAYRICLIGEHKQAYRAESGIELLAQFNLADCPSLDTLVIPGGSGTRESAIQAVYGPWLKARGKDTRRIATVCTGAFLLASTGLLDKLKATTHWNFEAQFRRQFPKVRLINDALYIDNGQISTSAGISSGIDLALKLVEDDCGAALAVQVARYLVVHYRRAGNQAQFSEPLKFQQKADGLFADITAYIMQHLQQPLSIDALAEQAGMSQRNFCRRFKQQTGQSPGRYVESLRLDYARQLLADKDWQLGQIAQACGYQSADVFRRAFERRFGVLPGEYRARFTEKT
ncbi:GlxA family transcriptional regulator [Aliiglaciecola sp. CAU 1673]|uniref:GlxA family transcriptional regulator n=1 Tax=Aliiglaciecola sp. CAU 1673 TaxID=3032595 RepID=UPI0023D986C7|nr:GlxA family transcriptional regulator [Aliiglaciecola sp. CAU 1673]MDF2178624.1 GlxA family transcriptional regulator [Aliiglaciecola sp. CAU 1673]